METAKETTKERRQKLKGRNVSECEVNVVLEKKVANQREDSLEMWNMSGHKRKK